MPVSADFQINWGPKTIEHIAGETVYSVNTLYSWLQDSFDELSAMDDQIAMKALTPTVYQWQNSWYMLTAGTSGNGYEFLSGGSVESADSNYLWSNLYSIGTQETGTNIYVIQSGAKLSSWWGTGNIDILVLVKDNGSFIDGGEVLVMSREYTDNYDHNYVGLSGGGRNVVGINTSDDSNNQSDASSVSGYGLTWNFGTSSFDLNNGAGARTYTCWINCNNQRLDDAYEQMKYETRTGATGQDFYISDGVSGDGEQYIAASSTFTAVKTAPFGTFAGGKFFGARGVWIYGYHALDAQNFQLLDASNVTQAPPNTVALLVNQVVSGDRVFVGPLTSAGGSLNITQYTVSGAHAADVQDLYVNEVVQTSSTPQSGVVRVGDYRHTYSAWANDGPSGHFTLTADISAGNPGPAGGYSGNEDVYVTFIDGEVADGLTEISNTMIQSQSVPVIIRVRRKGIIPFQTESTIQSNGMTVGAIRVTDTIVSDPETS